jgi:hypothetical protein
MFLKYTFRILIFLKFLLNLWMEVADSAFNAHRDPERKLGLGWVGADRMA